MAAPPLNLEASDAGGGRLRVAVTNAGDDTVVLPHAPVVGLRAVGDEGRWRSACKLDPVPSPTPLGPGQRSEWVVGWAEALRRPDGAPPPGDYQLQVVFRVRAGGPVTISRPFACALGDAAP